MGQTLSEPQTTKHTSYGEDDRLLFAVSEMQGWRLCEWLHGCGRDAMLRECEDGLYTTHCTSLWLRLLRFSVIQTHSGDGWPPANSAGVRQCRWLGGMEKQDEDIHAEHTPIKTASERFKLLQHPSRPSEAAITRKAAVLYKERRNPR